MTNLNNREDWLNKAVQLLRPLFEDKEVQPPPAIQISVGYVKGAKKNQVAWCYASKASSCGTVSNIFVSPEREDTDVAILGSVLHEMIHAADDCASDHKGRFQRVNKAMGFLGKPTSSADKSEALVLLLEDVADQLGPYPHIAMIGHERLTAQKTYMLLIEHKPCGFKIRATKKQVESAVEEITCWVCGEAATIE